MLTPFLVWSPTLYLGPLTPDSSSSITSKCLWWFRRHVIGPSLEIPYLLAINHVIFIESFPGFRCTNICSKLRLFYTVKIFSYPVHMFAKLNCCVVLIWIFWSISLKMMLTDLYFSDHFMIVTAVSNLVVGSTSQVKDFSPLHLVQWSKLELSWSIGWCFIVVSRFRFFGSHSRKQMLELQMLYGKD